MAPYLTPGEHPQCELFGIIKLAQEPSPLPSHPKAAALMPTGYIKCGKTTATESESTSEALDFNLPHFTGQEAETQVPEEAPAGGGAQSQLWTEIRAQVSWLLHPL